MTTVTTSKTYCDRPGCGAQVYFSSDGYGSIKFSIYCNGSGVEVASNNTLGADLCKNCASDLDKFWNAKKQ